MLTLNPINTWNVFPVDNRPLLISGPCSAESEEQLLQTAGELKKIGVNVIRAGIWKPRTRPNHFEGIGEKGLKWMQRIQEELDLKTATEVANGRHVEEALKAGIDLLWIGARSTSNPFVIQEIADALKGTDIPILVKNPLNPDLNLWIGALERLNMAGLHKIGAIHRGFFSTEKTKYRNMPYWQLPIALKCQFENMLLFCDPSHIAGDRAYIFEISQRAMDLGYEGLMIETHHKPSEALSDAEQQVTPEELKVILSELSVREKSVDFNSGIPDINRLRAEMDVIDDELLKLFARRMDISRKIGKYKRQSKIAILQPERWNMLLERLLKEGNAQGLDEKFIKGIFDVIHEESINVQSKE